jgi:hypothetical protein
MRLQRLFLALATAALLAGGAALPSTPSSAK